MEPTEPPNVKIGTPGYRSPLLGFSQAQHQKFLVEVFFFPRWSVHQEFLWKIFNDPIWHVFLEMDGLFQLQTSSFATFHIFIKIAGPGEIHDR